MKSKQEYVDRHLESMNGTQDPLPTAAASFLVKPRQQTTSIELDDAQIVPLSTAPSIIRSPLLITHTTQIEDQDSVLFNDICDPGFEDQDLFKQTKEEAQPHGKN